MQGGGILLLVITSEHKLKKAISACFFANKFDLYVLIASTTATFLTVVPREFFAGSLPTYLSGVLDVHTANGASILRFSVHLKIRICTRA